MCVVVCVILRSSYIWVRYLYKRYYERLPKERFGLSVMYAYIYASFTP